jgi:hypothetical protein
MRATMSWKQLKVVMETAESLKIKIYTDALIHLTQLPKWKALLSLKQAS